MEAMTGPLSLLASNSRMARAISSEAITSPPGESIRRITAFTRLSAEASSSCFLIVVTMSEGPMLDIIPVTSMTAIRFSGSPERRVTSVNSVRAGAVIPLVN